MYLGPVLLDSHMSSTAKCFIEPTKNVFIYSWSLLYNAWEVDYYNLMMTR